MTRQGTSGTAGIEMVVSGPVEEWQCWYIGVWNRE